jgi:hypothetical protein
MPREEAVLGIVLLSTQIRVDSTKWWSKMPEYDDFQEIGHCGGRIVFHIACQADGQRTYSFGVEHNRPTPATIVAVYALVPNGIPVADVQLGGIGAQSGPAPENCWPVFLGSDSKSCWGHECPQCHGYFRNGIHPAVYPLTCPYCGLRAGAYSFLTPAQQKYIQHYINTLLDALEREMAPGSDIDCVIDMDAVADKLAAEGKPDFYYTTETQQTRYKCGHCGEFNDIRGRYGYCASCGWRNNASSIQNCIAALRERLNNHSLSPENAVKESVDEFSSYCRDLTSQLTRRFPMKPRRRSEFERFLFHDVESETIARMQSMLDIDLFDGIGSDLPFVRMMFHRRHVYVHNACVADERYVAESGDPNGRLGVLIRETQENVHRFVSCLSRAITNFDRDFHEIFPPTDWPIQYYQERLASRTR